MEKFLYAPGKLCLQSVSVLIKSKQTLFNWERKWMNLPRAVWAVRKKPPQALLCYSMGRFQGGRRAAEAVVKRRRRVQAGRRKGRCAHRPHLILQEVSKHVLNAQVTRYLCHDGASLLRSSPEGPGEESRYQECSLPGAAFAKSKTDTWSLWLCQYWSPGLVRTEEYAHLLGSIKRKTCL